jgi:hypothetical protein
MARAAIALWDVKRRELRAMTDEDAVAGFDALDMPLELVWRSSARAGGAGLVETATNFQKGAARLISSSKPRRTSGVTSGRRSAGARILR